MQIKTKKQKQTKPGIPKTGIPEILLFWEKILRKILWPFQKCVRPVSSESQGGSLPATAYESDSALEDAVIRTARWSFCSNDSSCRSLDYKYWLWHSAMSEVSAWWESCKTDNWWAWNRARWMLGGDYTLGHGTIKLYSPISWIHGHCALVTFITHPISLKV
jgi:hypothetical protein